jgi:hypothetical protein
MERETGVYGEIIPKDGKDLTQFQEFLTEATTCTNEMAKETISENICQKRPLLSGGTPGQVTRGTCRLGQCRQGPAAVPSSGMLPLHRRRQPLWGLPPME